jgi:sugar lactone lactonase YvrE
VDERGNLYVAFYDRHQVVVFSPGGARLGNIALDNEEHVSTCAFGGASRKDLYI